RPTAPAPSPPTTSARSRPRSAASSRAPSEPSPPDRQDVGRMSDADTVTGAQGAGDAGSSNGGLSGKTAWARNLAAPVRDYLTTETGGTRARLRTTRDRRRRGPALRDDRPPGVGERAGRLLRVVLDDPALDPHR